MPDGLRIEPAGPEVRSRVQPVFPLVREGGGHVGADLGKHRRPWRAGKRKRPFGTPGRSPGRPFHPASAGPVGGRPTGPESTRWRAGPAPATRLWTDLP
ncbi:hypothetical protein GCM10010249_20850 [Streptomyces roseolilacinus]|uniref:Uncharacterized protein n=1 Tax=Streptomyces roseolilacinus TaxID=66904 RepID=A0A918B112_9ACTN|nr:hypothetical protein GCM10010249_20850 [Streptomyces roseolilacinus]